MQMHSSSVPSFIDALHLLESERFWDFRMCKCCQSKMTYTIQFSFVTIHSQQLNETISLRYPRWAEVE